MPVMCKEEAWIGAHKIESVSVSACGSGSNTDFEISYNTHSVSALLLVLIHIVHKVIKKYPDTDMKKDNYEIQHRYRLELRPPCPCRPSWWFWSSRN